MLDLAVGAPGDDAGGVLGDRGAVWIVLRAPGGGVAARRAIRAGEGVDAASLPERARFGAALAYLGDLDGDGDPELAVGAPEDDLDGLVPAGPGAVWILSLASDGSASRATRVTAGSGGFGGALDADEFGASVAPLGDRNGDGIADLVVGAPGDDDGPGDDSGAIWILHLGADGGVTSWLKISRTQGGLGSGPGSNERLGTAVAASGDLDADGVADLAAGAPNAGAIWILFLQPDGTVRAKQRIRNGEGGLGSTNLDLGRALAPLGDLNGDGTPDLAAGAPGTSFVTIGSAVVLFLQPTGTVAAWTVLEWARTTGGLLSAFGRRLATHGDGSFTRTGTGGGDFDVALLPSSFVHAFVAGYDGDGSTLWARSEGGTGLSAFALAALGGGASLLVGQYHAEVVLGLDSPQPLELPHSGGSDAFGVGWDADGELLAP